MTKESLNFRMVCYTMIIIMILLLAIGCSKPKPIIHPIVVTTTMFGVDTIMGTTVICDPMIRMLKVKKNDTLVVVYRLGENDSYRVYEINP